MEFANLLPPQDLDAERGMIGSGLLFNDVLDDVAEVVKPESCYLDAHGKILAAMLALHQRSKPADAVTVSDELRKRKQLEEVGGDEYLIRILNSVPHAAHAKYYAGIVQEKFILRQFIYASTDFLKDAYQAAQPATELLERSAGMIHKLIENQSGGQAFDMTAAMLSLMEYLESDTPPGLSTGYIDLDRLLKGGIRPGNLIILAARPSMGKTAFAANLAWNMSQATTVFFISLEQSRLELTERLLGSLLSKPGEALREMMRDDDQRDSVMDAINQMNSRPILIDDRPGRSVAEIAAMCRVSQRKHKHKLGAIIVDYLQMISPEDKRAPREIQVSSISRQLKELAKSFNVPVIALAQLNRAIETRDDKRPRLSDLRESGAIEQDADLIWFLDRPSKYSSEAKPTDANLIVAKHRNGKIGVVPLHWDGDSMTFRNAARDDADTWADPYEDQ